jgi:NhaA family Na+:H+ antiporter
MTTQTIHHQTDKKKFSFKKFFHESYSVGIILLFCTLLSLILTNISGVGEFYNSLWEFEIPLAHELHLPHTLLHFINDALMAIFFFHVGMEIKREVVAGELSSPRRMLLPVVAAVSGVLFPALIFLITNAQSPYQAGWAIPTATDIAFSLGILSLLGKSVPHSLKIFLTALAIIDDLCAILIIALFYASNLNLIWLTGVIVSVLAIFFIIRYYKTKLGKRLVLILTIATWYCMYRSGIHSTFAGVVIAMLLPIDTIRVYERKLHLPVNFAILPLFALANTSILITAPALASLTSTLSLGIFLGLFVGKPLGISLAIFGLTKSRILSPMSSSRWLQFMGVSILAGIGFTMSIFVSTLAFDNTAIQDTSKLSVLIASFLSMIVGYFWLRMAFRGGEKQLDGDIKSQSETV